MANKDHAAPKKRRRVVVDAGTAAGIRDAETDAEANDPVEQVPTPAAAKAGRKGKAAKTAPPPADDDQPENDRAVIGSNSGAVISDGVKVAKDELRSIVERVERLEEEKKGISDDIKDVYAEAKSVGYDVKVLRKYIAQRKVDKAKREEEEAIMDLYRVAVEG